MPRRDIVAVMNDNAARIMAVDGVVMVAVGKLDDGTPCIQVYVRRKSEELVAEIGGTIEGHPVDYIVSDGIRPL